MSTNSSVIEAYLQREMTKYLEELSRLCAQPSVAAKGEGIKECSELVASMLRERGFEVEILPTPGSPVVIGRMAGRSPRTLLCYNHYDVQPAEPFDLWTSPPFQPEIRDGKMYARGVVDDKGEIVARLAAIDALREANGGELPCGILFVIEGEEEIGSPNIEQFVQKHKDKLACDGSLWEGGGVSDDGRSVLALGYRGILSVRIEIETM